MAYEHTICQHCDDAPCLKACPEQGHLQARRRGGHHRPDKCRGNHNCVEACPYEGVIFFNEDLQHRPEVHLLRPPARRGLDRDPLRRGLSDRGLHLRRGRGPGRSDRQGRAAAARARRQAAGLLHRPAQDVHRRRRLRPGGRRVVEGAAVTPTRAGTAPTYDGRHRRVRRLLGSTGWRWASTRAHREGGLPAAEDGGPSTSTRTSTSATSPSGRRAPPAPEDGVTERRSGKRRAGPYGPALLRRQWHARG